MKKLIHWIGAIALILAPSVTTAQSTIVGKQIAAPAGFLPATAAYCDDGTGKSAVCTNGGKQESFKLVNANTPSSGATVFGGDYILSQMCAAYGTLSLQVLGPDGTTYQTILSKTASDSTGGTGLALGSFATVRITVSGTTSCNAVLSRVPA